MDGMPGFKFGAYALAHYALAKREEMWDLLVWEGKHPQAPVSVAMKTHYFCELDVKETVRALLHSCPDFWRSEQMRASLESGEFIALAPDYFVQLQLSYSLKPLAAMTSHFSR
eukprot:gene3738-13795_t